MRVCVKYEEDISIFETKNVLCTVDVDKEKFLIAVDAFTKKHEGENYYLLDFSSNSVAFKNYVLSKSNIY
ncbi:MAG: hypothetical protein P8X70_02170 [Nanoarchaeota archaeon]